MALTRRAGGIVIGKTATTEFATMVPAVTRNPHNLAVRRAARSSGSCAAIAAGMLPITFGTQTAGSVIRPAAFCGIAGFKPSYRLIPTAGVEAVTWHLDTAGVFGAGVADVASSPRRSPAATCASIAQRLRRRASRWSPPSVAASEPGDATGARRRGAERGGGRRQSRRSHAAADL